MSLMKDTIYKDMSSDDDSPIISIIIPYYNVPSSFFDKCFESIINQTFKKFEVIVIDDGSDTSIGEYLKEKIKGDKRFKLISQRNCGVSVARNKGLSEAIGKTVCFIDADDYVAPWLIEDLWNAYSQNDVQAVAAYYNLTKDDNFIFNRNTSKFIIQDAKKLIDISIIGMNCTKKNNGFLSAGPVSVMFDLNIAKTIRFPAGIKYMEDVIWNICYFNSCKRILILDECLYAYRQNNNSATHRYSKSMIEDRKKALLIIKKMLTNNNEWYPLRLFSNYTMCCRCIMKTAEYNSFSERVDAIQKLYRDSIWDDFKKKGISKKWSSKYKVKYYLAVLRLLPYIYSIK